MTLLDAVLVERSDVRVATFKKGPPFVHFRPGKSGVVLKRSITQGHHLWRGGYHLAGSRFFSDELMKRVEGLGMSKLEKHYIEEA